MFLWSIKRLFWRRSQSYFVNAASLSTFFWLHVAVQQVRSVAAYFWLSDFFLLSSLFFLVSFRWKDLGRSGPPQQPSICLLSRTFCNNLAVLSTYDNMPENNKTSSKTSQTKKQRNKETKEHMTLHRHGLAAGIHRQCWTSYFQNVMYYILLVKHF